MSVTMRTSKSNAPSHSPSSSSTTTQQTMSTHTRSSNSQGNWRSRTLSRLQNAVPKLKRLVNRRSKKGRKALWKLLEGQRKDFVKGLEMDDHDTHGGGCGGHGRISNLQALLSLPLELDDLETCLHLGVAGALQQPSTNLPSSSQDEHLPLDLDSIDADANFLAEFVVGNDYPNNATKSPLDSPAGVALADPTAFLRTNSTSTTLPTYKVGGMAQITAMLLMVAQILIGAQLLKRRRKRTAASLPSTSAVANAQSQAHAHAQSTEMPSQAASDGTNRSSRGRGRSVSPSASSVKSRRGLGRSRSRSNLGDDPKRQMRRRSSARDLRKSLSRSCSFDNEVPPLAKPSASASTSTSTQKANTTKPPSTSASHGESSSSLQDHIQAQPSSTHHAARNKTNPKEKLASNEHDDNGTAETDSLSLSEGVPQAIKEDQRQHSHTETHGPPLNNSNSNSKDNHNAKDVLALLSFEGSTKSQLEAGRSIVTSLPPMPSFAQDKFALRMSKLKNELFHVKQEQKNKIQDSTHRIQLRYQETNQQYSDLTKRLQNLTVAVQPTPPTRPKSPAIVPRAPSPQQLQVQANIQANSQEQTKLLNKVNSLQQELKTQQERHVQELQQREAALQQMKTKIQFMNQELERRILHSQKIDEERVAQRAQEGKVTSAAGDVAKLHMQQQQLSRELQETKQKFLAKERECQELLQRLRNVPPPSSLHTAAQNQADAEVHSALMKELETQLKEQDEMNKKTFEMTQLLDVKRADIIERTNQMEQMSTELEKRRLKVEAMEANAKTSIASSGISTSQLEKELRQLRDAYESQSLECEKLNEIVTHKSKLLQEKEKECLELTGKLEEMSEMLRAKEAQIEQLEQDVQDKQDLAAQNEAITQELQVQQDLQEKMNKTTLQMIKLLEEKEKSNEDLTNRLEALTEELNQAKE